MAKLFMLIATLNSSKLDN